MGSQNGTQGPCRAPDTLELHYTALMRTGVPKTRCRSREYSLHLLQKKKKKATKSIDIIGNNFEVNAEVCD